MVGMIAFVGSTVRTNRLFHEVSQRNELNGGSTQALVGRRDRGKQPRRPTDHMATTASRSFSAVAPFACGAASGASATAWASLAYSFVASSSRLEAS